MRREREARSAHRAIEAAHRGIAPALTLLRSSAPPRHYDRRSAERAESNVRAPKPLPNNRRREAGIEERLLSIILVFLVSGPCGLPGTGPVNCGECEHSQLAPGGSSRTRAS